MLIGIGASIYSGNRYDAAISSANLAARFDASLGITSSGGFASAWADQSGNGRNLLQATGANQPIHLPFAGTKYGWLPGVAGNYFSTPDSVANSDTGSKDLRFKLFNSNWAAGGVLTNRNSNNIQFDTFGGGGLLRLAVNHSSATAYATSDVSPTTVFANNTVGWLRATYDITSGEVLFYTSSDGVAWDQLGTAQSLPTGAIDEPAGVMSLGSDNVGTNPMPTCRIYRAQIYNGIDGTLAVDFDPSRWTSGTTFTAATGETWTINSTGSKPAQIVDRPSLLFDGAAHYMKTDPFTLNQPETVYLVAKPISWTGGDYFIDGETADSMVIYQVTATPNIALYSGTTGPQSTSATLGASHVIGAVFNGANSILQIDSGAASTANAGTRNAGGFTLGMYSGGGFYGNIQVYEALIYNVAHDAATRSNIIRALMSKHGAA